MDFNPYSNNYTRWTYPTTNAYSKRLALEERFAKLTGAPSNQRDIIRKKAELEILLRANAIPNAATKASLLREIGDLIAAKRAKNTANMAARFTKLTGRPPVQPLVIGQPPVLVNGSIRNTRSNTEKVRAYLARLLSANPQNLNEIARVQKLLPPSSTSFETYPLPSTSASTGFGAVSPPATSAVSLAGYDPRASALSITFPETMTQVDQEATANRVLAAISKNEKSITVPAGVTITLTPAANSSRLAKSVSTPSGGAGSSSSPATSRYKFVPDPLTTPTYLIPDPIERMRIEGIQAIAKIPTGAVKKGGRSRRLKSKRNKRTRRHVR